MRRNVIGAVLVTVLALAALGAAGFGLYQIGYDQGLVETGADVVVNARGPGWHPGYWGFGGPGGFGVFGLFFRVLFVFLIIGLVARLFFGRRGWGPGPYWARDWEGNHRSPMEQRLSEWHEKAHGDESPPEPKPDQHT
jgi:hypothetical protein